jgi:hypothetical protein
MTEIIDGFTSIWTGTDPISSLGDHRPTGARVTVEFCREKALRPGETVCAHYDFSGDGRMRTATGVAQSTHSVARSGSATLFHYRISHWIEPDALTERALDSSGAARAGDRSPA